MMMMVLMLMNCDIDDDNYDQFVSFDDDCGPD